MFLRRAASMSRSGQHARLHGNIWTIMMRSAIRLHGDDRLRDHVTALFGILRRLDRNHSVCNALSAFCLILAPFVHGPELLGHAYLMRGACDMFRV
jgi:hypothetical protein